MLVLHDSTLIDTFRTGVKACDLAAGSGSWYCQNYAKLQQPLADMVASTSMDGGKSVAAAKVVLGVK